MGREMDSILEDARNELREWAKENPDEDEPHDTISEISDSSVPVYTYDILELGAGNFDLMTAVPELGPAFDGTPTPVNIIAANIYEKIQESLWDEWRLIESGREDAELEEDDEELETE